MLVYAGHVGTGFDEPRAGEADQAAEAARNQHESRSASAPRTNEKPHWVKPTLVAQVKFTEWTADGSLRHPVYLGLRDDKKARTSARGTRPEVPGARGSTGPGFQGADGSKP